MTCPDCPPADAWWLTDTAPFVARWDCGRWSAWEGWATVAANLVIAACYYLIPAVGWWLLRRRPGLAPVPLVAHLSLAFVVACGTTHVLDAAAFWWPAYRLNLLARGLTAAVSTATLAVLWRRRRHLAGYVTPEEHAAVAAERDRAAAEVEAVRRDMLAEFDRRGRLQEERGRQLDALKAELETLLHRELTDADYAQLRKRMHALRGVS